MPDSSPSTIEATEPDLSGRRIGDYQLLRRLGRGGMADVYLAEQGSLHRQVAFKVLKSSLAGDETYVLRFENEARAAASLVQANIVQIYEVGHVEGIRFIAQEYVQGQNLKQVMQRRGSFDAKLAVNIMRQVAAALHKAGERGVVHRDIKPDNIMLSAEGEVKVADFGLARVNSASRVDLTQIGVTMGTPLYMSPEQVEGKPLDPRSDIYSFGVTCYQMLSGRTPFEGDTPLAIAVQHLKTDAERLEVCRPDLPPGLCRVVHKMLEKSPADRFQRAAELLRDLRSLQIEGVEEEWPKDLGDWSTAEFLALAESRTQATQELGRAMRTEALLLGRKRRPWWPVLFLLVPLCFAGGAGAAWALRPLPLLAPGNPIEGKEPKVEKMKSARAQFAHALFLDTEEAYKSVWEYFPPELSRENEVESWKAKRRLGELYLREDERELALGVFNELAALEEIEEQYRIFGLAGQAIVYGRNGDREGLARTLPYLIDTDIEKQQLIDDLMRTEIQLLFLEYEQPRKRDDGRTGTGGK
jgi:predicted Ser/Thr protein kinase